MCEIKSVVERCSVHCAPSALPSTVRLFSMQSMHRLFPIPVLNCAFEMRSSSTYLEHELHHVHDRGQHAAGLPACTSAAVVLEFISPIISATNTCVSIILATYTRNAALLLRRPQGRRARRGGADSSHGNHCCGPSWSIVDVISSFSMSRVRFTFGSLAEFVFWVINILSRTSTLL